MYKLSPSILAADFARLGEEIIRIERAGADYVHIDVMDGNFVPSLTIGMPIIEALRKHSGLVFDVHLMIAEPIRYIKAFQEAGADIICVHQEACRHLDRTVETIREAGLLAGVVLNPATPVSMLENILPKLDMVLIMAVNPGFGGQQFIPYTYDKIRALKKMIDQRKLSVDIEVDGGVTLDNVGDILAAGANIIVAGTAVFSGDVFENVKAFKEEFAHASDGHKSRQAD